MHRKNSISIFRPLAAFFICLAALVCFGPRLMASASYVTPARGTEYNVTDFGANGSDRADDRRAFQAALDMARDNNNMVTVTVPKGTYYISSSLFIYSNTIFRLDSGAVLKSTHNNDYIMTFGKDSPAYQTNRNWIHNVTISGGTWDSNNTDTTECKGLLKICNADNITLDGVVFKNVVGTHFVVLDGISNSLIKNCQFLNFRDYTGTEEQYYDQVFAGLNYWSCEALHIDFIPRNGIDLNGQPYVPSTNVEVTGCTFKDLASGVGTHHVFDYTTQKGINIHDNTFRNCYYDCINATSFTDLKCSGNKAYNCGGFLVCRRTSGTVVNNSAELIRDPSGWWYNKGKFSAGYPNFVGIEGSNRSNLTLTGNVIKGGSSQSIWLSTSTARITDNTVSGSRVNGICVNTDSTASLTGNRVTDSGKNGISVNGSSMVTSLTGNTVSGSAENGIYASSSTLSSASSNRITGAGYNGFSLANGSKAVLSYNTVASCSHNGVYLSTGSNGTMTSNTLSSNKKNGFSVSGSAAKITGNSLQGNKGNDLYVSGGSVNVVYRNNGSDVRRTKVESGCHADISGTGRLLTASMFSVQRRVPANGGTVAPAVGSALVKNRDYTVDYRSYSAPGRASVYITGKGEYSGTLVLDYIIVPSAPKVKSVNCTTGISKAKWTNTSPLDGYSLRVSPNANMSGASAYTVAGTVTSMSIPGLTKGRTYYVQVAGYKNVDGTKYTGPYSKAMKFTFQ